MLEITFLNQNGKKITVEDAEKLTGRHELIKANVIKDGKPKVWDVTKVKRKGKKLKVTRIKGYDTYIYTLS